MGGTPVGRDGVLAELLAWVGEARRGSGRLIAVCGDAGIGKSTTARAVADLVAADGLPVAWGRAAEDTGAPAFWPWRQVLSALDAPALLELDRMPTVPPSDPDAERFQRFDATVGQLAERASSAGGLLIVLEDLHRADESSLRLLRHLAGQLEDHPIAVLGTHRVAAADHRPGAAEHLDRLRQLPGTRQLALGGLDAAAVAALLGDDADPATVTKVLDTTGGNALFVAEIARHLAAGGEVGAVPPSVRGLVAGRLRERSERCVELLQLAAVIGREFTAGVAATALGRSAVTCLEDLDEATDAGLVEVVSGGAYRFVHSLVRDAVVSTLPAAVVPTLHRRVAEAIEAYEGATDDRLAEIAEHRAAAAVVDGRADAAAWLERAAEVAGRSLAWEEAAHLYDRSVLVGGVEASAEDRYRRLLGSARNRARATDVGAVVACCRDAAAVARQLDRPDLLAECALVIEGRGGPAVGALRELSEEALAALDAAPLGALPATQQSSLRARLLGQLAVVSFYLDPDRVERLSLRADAEARASADPLAVVAAVRARQMALLRPGHLDELADLARRMGDAGRSLGQPGIEMWEYLWRIEAELTRGELGRATELVGLLRRCVEAVPTLINRWHLARTEALLAQAEGRFDIAGVRADEARALFSAAEDPVSAQAQWLGFHMGTVLHLGMSRELAEAWITLPDVAPGFLGDLPRFGPMLARFVLGDHAAAGGMYDRLPPVPTWQPPPFLLPGLLVIRLRMALLLERAADVAALHHALEPYEALHVTTRGGGTDHGGPVVLWMAMASEHLGELDRAATEASTAIRVCDRSGLPAFGVQARIVLAEVLARRGKPGDETLARARAAEARVGAEVMGMLPWIERLAAVDRRLATQEGTVTSPLSPREQEVAALVARGLTNRQIAGELFLSERTAQNHVQHILVKLGFSSRAQIAAWHAGARNPDTN